MIGDMRVLELAITSRTTNSWTVGGAATETTPHRAEVAVRETFEEDARILPSLRETEGSSDQEHQSVRYDMANLQRKSVASLGHFLDCLGEGENGGLGLSRKRSEHTQKERQGELQEQEQGDVGRYRHMAWRAGNLQTV